VECEKYCNHCIGEDEIEVVWVVPGSVFGSKPISCKVNNKKPCRFYPVFDLKKWKALHGSVPFPPYNEKSY